MLGIADRSRSTTETGSPVIVVDDATGEFFTRFTTGTAVRRFAIEATKHERILSTLGEMMPLHDALAALPEAATYGVFCTEAERAAWFIRLVGYLYPRRLVPVTIDLGFRTGDDIRALAASVSSGDVYCVEMASRPGMPFAQAGERVASGRSWTIWRLRRGS